LNLEKLISGCKRNDRQSQETLYKNFFPLMMSVAMRYMNDRDRASAIVNDGFLKIFTKIDTYAGKGSFEGWMRRIVFRSVSDAVRKDGNYLKFMVFDDEDRRQISHSNTLSKLYEEDLLKLIDLIPPSSGEVFTLFAIHGYTHKEIAEQKKISVGTSKWHLSDARKRLQGLILRSYNAG